MVVVEIENGVIYMVENKLNGKKYIGLTTLESPIERWNRHKEVARGDVGYMYYFHRAIAKYGEDNFGFRVLESGFRSFQELCAREGFYIELLNTFGDKGYNLTLGGEGTLGHKSGKHLNKPVVKIDIITGRSLRRYKSTTEAAENNGVDRSSIADAARCVGGYSGGYAWVYEENYGEFSFDRHRYTYHSRVFQLDKYTGEVVGVFEGTREAAEKVGLVQPSVCDAIKNKLVSQGYIFIRETEYSCAAYAFDITEYLSDSAVVKLDKTTGEVLGYYYSNLEAAKDVGLLCQSSISVVINGKCRTAGGYRWVRYSDFTTLG